LTRDLDEELKDLEPYFGRKGTMIFFAGLVIGRADRKYGRALMGDVWWWWPWFEKAMPLLLRAWEEAGWRVRKGSYVPLKKLRAQFLRRRMEKTANERRKSTDTERGE